MATMKQVAERAGVSTSTVSHVINATRAVSEDVRVRVLATIDEMGYIPNAMARSLKNDKSHTIGVSIPDNTDPCLAELLRGIEDAAFEVGYTIMLCNGYQDARRQAAHLRSLIEKRIDGLILVAGAGRDELAPLLASQRLPIVLADHEVPSVEADFIGLDHEATGHAAARHLIELGHRRIACVAGPRAEPHSLERIAGLRRALDEAGIGLAPHYLVHGAPDCAGGHDAVRGLLALGVPPTAIFACNDLMALGGLCAAREAGVAVPQDLSVLGGDDLGMAAYTTPRLSSVAQPTYAMGRRLTALLIARVRGEGGARRHERLAGRLVARQSTAPAPALPIPAEHDIARLHNTAIAKSTDPHV
ncbi:LacI family transcriptional regulator [Massilia sp. IC2-477]|uniref:LacI family DNA-binding transcriptional regulator n=1 Tax=Massilia sp. IC2-477 TaxID=2887198 RepID=UPI001D1186C8|nr:LacI family DNA-binding transcriptional regulator [Massilia sp. IC2-477]MCC2958760.1 LacI family transcriptional regulator [Massilia sp. IC2-477]